MSTAGKEKIKSLVHIINACKRFNRLQAFHLSIENGQVFQSCPFFVIVVRKARKTFVNSVICENAEIKR